MDRTVQPTKNRHPWEGAQTRVQTVRLARLNSARQARPKTTTPHGVGGDARSRNLVRRKKGTRTRPSRLFHIGGWHEPFSGPSWVLRVGR
jgi:hypothetical protein